MRFICFAQGTNKVGGVGRKKEINHILVGMMFQAIF
jgi:hypothetical protein